MAKPKNDKFILVAFMNFVHGAEYEYNYQFTPQELGTITPQKRRMPLCTMVLVLMLVQWLTIMMSCNRQGSSNKNHW